MKLRMSLLENSYDSLNESLRKTIEANRYPKAWKFALLNVVQTIELLLKERLRREHHLLVYKNVDQPPNTVSLSLSVHRLQESLGIPLQSEDVAAIHKARRIRNEIQHFEFDIPVTEMEAVYSLLFEFASSFHREHLGSELHSHIDEALWDREAELIQVFRNEYVSYNGQKVIKEWPLRIREAQAITHYELGDGRYPRIKFGDEPHMLGNTAYAKSPCHDCAVVKGEFHVPDCDVEECPRCGGQMITCGCELMEPDADDIGD
jgi:hypothetical protein